MSNNNSITSKSYEQRKLEASNKLEKEIKSFVRRATPFQLVEAYVAARVVGKHPFDVCHYLLESLFEIQAKRRDIDLIIQEFSASENKVARHIAPLMIDALGVQPGKWGKLIEFGQKFLRSNDPVIIGAAKESIEHLFATELNLSFAQRLELTLMLAEAKHWVDETPDDE